MLSPLGIPHTDLRDAIGSLSLRGVYLCPFTMRMSKHLFFSFFILGLQLFESVIRLMGEKCPENGQVCQIIGHLGKMGIFSLCYK